MTTSPSPHGGFENVLLCPLTARGATGATRQLLDVMAAGSTLVVVGVVAEPTRLQSFIHGGRHVTTVVAAGRRRARQLVDRCVAVASRDGRHVSPQGVVEVGHLTISILARTIASGHDLLALSVDDDTDLAPVRRLLRNGSCPVWIVRASRSTRPHVVAAIDVDSGEDALNVAILRAAESIAGETGDLHLVTSWELYGESTLQSSAFIHVDDAELAAMRDQVRSAHEQAAAALVAANARDPERWAIHVEHGEASNVIERAIGRWHATSIVIGTVARSGVGGLVMGNTAERVVDAVRCSVLVVQPPRRH